MKLQQFPFYSGKLCRFGFDFLYYSYYFDNEYATVHIQKKQMRRHFFWRFDNERTSG